MNWLDKLPIDSQWLTGLAIISAITFIASLIFIPWLVTKLPVDYFVDKKRHSSQLHTIHPLVYFVIRLLKNSLGVILILAGIVMLVLPGQGILSILVGIGLTDFPGKFKLERWFAKQPAVFKAMNWIREKAKIESLLDP